MSISIIASFHSLHFIANEQSAILLEITSLGIWK